MKLNTLLALPMIVLSLQAKATIICSEVAAQSGAAQKEIVIEKVANVRSQVRYGIEYDDVWKVNIQINDIKNGQKTPLQNFEAIATTAGIQYDIDAKRKNGFELWRYLHDGSHDGFSLKGTDGKVSTYRLQCK
jgi:hypothetical protein